MRHAPHHVRLSNPSLSLIPLSRSRFPHRLMPSSPHVHAGYLESIIHQPLVPSKIPCRPQITHDVEELSLAISSLFVPARFHIDPEHPVISYTRSSEGVSGGIRSNLVSKVYSRRSPESVGGVNDGRGTMVNCALVFAGLKLSRGSIKPISTT